MESNRGRLPEQKLKSRPVRTPRGFQKLLGSGLVAILLGGLFLLLSALLLSAALLLFLLRRVLGERHGHGGESQRKAEHEGHQFLHCVSPVRRIAVVWMQE